MRPPCIALLELGQWDRPIVGLVPQWPDVAKLVDMCVPVSTSAVHSVKMTGLRRP